MISLSDINNDNFSTKALEVFHFQAKNNPIYKKYLDCLNCDIEQIDAIDGIPFLPIDFFKTHKISSTTKPHHHFFQSSGTSQMQRSKHYVYSIDLYEKSFLGGFSHFYGKIQDYRILALLPSYQENPHSSLIYMVDKMIALTKENGSRYISLSEYKSLLEETKKKTLLIGVSFALLDLAERHPIPLSNTIVMETGGMKGRRKEITRQELHTRLCDAFSIEKIQSEYGMSELLSQAYSKGDGIFACPPWMKVSTRPLNQPFGRHIANQNGILKIIDLANYYSCSFIETADMGKVKKNGTFEVIGRVDNSDIRGCNLLIEN